MQFHVWQHKVIVTVDEEPVDQLVTGVVLVETAPGAGYLLFLFFVLLAVLACLSVFFAFGLLS